MIYFPCSRMGTIKFLDYPRQDEKLPVEPDNVHQVFTIDTIIPYEEYSVSPEPSKLNIGPLNAKQGKQFSQLLMEFSDLFAQDTTELG
jgi:hypothetical protein